MKTNFYKSEYSEKEIKLIKFFGYDDILPELYATQVYDICMKKAFIHNLHGPEVKSLRKVIKAISDCSPYRMTPEFDALIED